MIEAPAVLQMLIGVWPFIATEALIQLPLDLLIFGQYFHLKNPLVNSVKNSFYSFLIKLPENLDNLKGSCKINLMQHSEYPQNLG